MDRTSGSGLQAVAKGLLAAALAVLPWTARAGTLDSPAGPTSGDSAMYTIEDIYKFLSNGKLPTKRTGAFTEPTSGPTAGTGHTLDELMALVRNRHTPKTGQTPTVPLNPAPAGSDGALQKGAAWPAPRFADNDDGTVTDNLTGLVWLKKANYIGTDYTGFDADGRVTWQQALDFVAGMNVGTYGNFGQTDWRLPNVQEMLSLIAWQYYSPALADTAGTAQWTDGDPFTGVQSSYYWSSTTNAPNTDVAWFVSLYDGAVASYVKTYTYYVWPVRGGL